MQTISADRKGSAPHLADAPLRDHTRQGHLLMDLNLKDQKVIVTAGAQGIGLAITAAFVEAGAHVHICDVSEDFLASARARFGHAPVSYSRTEIGRAHV